jgi:hypothetical protein
MALDYAPAIRAGCPEKSARWSWGIFYPPAFHLRGADVDGFRDRFRDDFRFARAGHDVVLRAGEFYPAQSCDPGSRDKIFDPERPLDRLFGLRNHLDLWSHGETNLARISTAVGTQTTDQVPLLFGIALVLVALGFKIAAVRFKFGCRTFIRVRPTPVTAFLSVGSKAAGFVVLLRVLAPFLALPQIGRLLTGVAALTLIYGNFAALPQTNLKRLLAYSSIAHAGYLLIGVVALSGAAVSYYLVAYLLMTLLSFAC